MTRTTIKTRDARIRNWRIYHAAETPEARFLRALDAREEARARMQAFIDNPQAGDAVTERFVRRVVAAIRGNRHEVGTKPSGG